MMAGALMPIEFLLIPFGIVLTTGLVLLRLSWQHMRRAPLPMATGVRTTDVQWNGLWDHAEFLAHGSARWLAVKSTNLGEVQQALKLTNPTPCTWREGLARRVENRLLLSPPIAGWVLVVGHDLPDPAEDVDSCYLFLQRLSVELGEVHYYSANRVLHHHAWARLEWGSVVRAYAWAGQTLWNQEPMTAAESKLGLICDDYSYPVEREPLDPSPMNAINEERIFQLAACWSIDPTRIADQSFRGASGLSGELSAGGNH